MFCLDARRKEYFNDYVTVIEDYIPEHLCDQLAQRVNDVILSKRVDLVDHEGLGNKAVSDFGGRYLHHIFKGSDIREHLPELVSIYHSALPLVSLITCSDAIVSPYSQSDINIKAYPPGGGALGAHYDSNGITVLLFLTTNKEAPLRMQIPRSHPSKPDSWIEHRNIYAKKGALLLLQGRKILHDCEPTKTEQKLTAVLNYYTEGDTFRHKDFDDFVYYGHSPSGFNATSEGA